MRRVLDPLPNPGSLTRRGPAGTDIDLMGQPLHGSSISCGPNSYPVYRRVRQDDSRLQDQHWSLPILFFPPKVQVSTGQVPLVWARGVEKQGARLCLC